MARMRQDWNDDSPLESDCIGDMRNRFIVFI